MHLQTTQPHDPLISPDFTLIPGPSGTADLTNFTVITLILYGTGSTGLSRTRILKEIRAFITPWPSPPDIILFQECNSGESPTDIFKYQLTIFQIHHPLASPTTSKHDLATLVSKDFGTSSSLDDVLYLTDQGHPGRASTVLEKLLLKDFRPERSKIVQNGNGGKSIRVHE
ncbi:hypothetical protein H4219_006472 [Mycoemilia scoparia]|uniref:Uncharacterized protein n=1 Tax=Mycoemilia scoparia TaxID=417184 RepID=A0A9W7ZQ92_9FUNG|nr:hypothetical protein H4219_006472 [Mycoemilia scoparia]